MELDKFFSSQIFPWFSVIVFAVVIGVAVAVLLAVQKKRLSNFRSERVDNFRFKSEVIVTLFIGIISVAVSVLIFELNYNSARIHTCLNTTLELRKDIGNFKSLPVENGFYRDVINVQSDPNNIGYSVGREYRVKLQNSIEGWIFSCRNLTKAIDDKPRLWHSIPLQNSSFSWTVSNVNELSQLTTDVLGELL